MKKPQKFIYSAAGKMAQPLSLKEVLQLRDGIGIIKNQGSTYSPNFQLVLKNLIHKASLN